MRIDYKLLGIFALSAYIMYYIFIQNELISEQKQIMEDQYNLINTQRSYIIEINKILGLDAGMRMYQPRIQHDNPVHGPI
jgi:hypothetical protein